METHILHIRGCCKLPSWCEAVGKHALEHDRLEVGTGQIDGGRVSGWTRANNDLRHMQCCSVDARR